MSYTKLDMVKILLILILLILLTCKDSNDRMGTHGQVTSHLQMSVAARIFGGKGGTLTYKNGKLGNSLVVQWLRLLSFTAVGPGSITGQGTVIWQVMGSCQKHKTKMNNYYFWAKVLQAISPGLCINETISLKKKRNFFRFQYTWKGNILSSCHLMVIWKFSFSFISFPLMNACNIYTQNISILLNYSWFIYILIVKNNLDGKKTH